MLLPILLIAAPLSSVTPAPADGVANAETLAPMVRADVASLVVDEARASSDREAVVLPAADTSELSFIDLYFPFMPDENLHPDLDKDLVVVWIVHVFLGILVGPLWIPKMLTKLEPDDEYQTEALINWLIHAVIFVFGAFTSYIFGIGLIINAVNLIWLFPVATINSFNRHIAGGGGGKKKKGGGGKSAVRDLPGMPLTAQLEPAAVVAY